MSYGGTFFYKPLNNQRDSIDRQRNTGCHFVFQLQNFDAVFSVANLPVSQPAQVSEKAAIKMTQAHQKRNTFSTELLVKQLLIRQCKITHNYCIPYHDLAHRINVCGIRLFPTKAIGAWF